MMPSRLDQPCGDPSSLATAAVARYPCGTRLEFDEIDETVVDAERDQHKDMERVFWYKRARCRELWRHGTKLHATNPA